MSRTLRDSYTPCVNGAEARSRPLSVVRATQTGLVLSKMCAINDYIVFLRVFPPLQVLSQIKYGGTLFDAWTG